MADALWHLANESQLQGRKEEARQLAREAVETAERSGDRERLADTFFVLGTIEQAEDRLAAFERFASLGQHSRRKRRFARRLSAAASLVGDEYPREATEWFNRCIAIARDLSDPVMEGDSLRGIGNLARAAGDEKKAAELLALANVMCPVPDVSELIAATRANDLQAAERMLRKMYHGQPSTCRPRESPGQ